MRCQSIKQDYVCTALFSQLYKYTLSNLQYFGTKQTELLPGIFKTFSVGIQSLMSIFELIRLDL